MVRPHAEGVAPTICCWFSPTWAIWILSIPTVGSLVINFILLLNILRILLSKIRAFNSAEHNQNRRAVKAVLILIPLLGLQNMLTLIKPPMDKEAVMAWEMLSAILVSYQGAAVALIFCFFNGEVLAVLKRRWDQWRHNYDPAFMSRPSNSTTMAMTLDESTVNHGGYRNGNKRVAKTSSKHAKDATELQLMVPGNKGEKGVTFEN
ncbi:calcitonin gene-related peptide type 1 receptor [Aplysia californica]|uniref:Calcitonin gene-related peptide type 1 receptor n=1 Tax=Aplysia californica TaxID=6500 RepID=A0ABM0JK73_APLCA|nr:calcitonin gene-related peptide type 1 receptor [Aplysia californica]